MDKIYSNWLKKYLKEQEKKNAGIIKELFDKDGEYWWGPFNKPCIGLEAIYEHHSKALSHQDDIKYEYEVLAVNKNFCLAKFYLKVNDLMPNEPNTYEGIFQVFLNDAGKCLLFKEWYNFVSI